MEVERAEGRGMWLGGFSHALFPTLSTLLSACSMIFLPWPPLWSLFVLSWVGQTMQGGCQDQRRCPAKLRSEVSPTTKAIERPRAQTNPSASQTAPSTESGHASALALRYVVRCLRATGSPYDWVISDPAPRRQSHHYCLLCLLEGAQGS